MARHKLSYHQILNVIQHGTYLARGTPSSSSSSCYLRGFAAAASVLDPTGRHTLPGTYVAVADGVILPKKRRGEKFLVRYTTAHEKEF
jgi:hypothetical protein